MPFNGSGTFNRVYSWAADAAAGIDITASRFDTQENDFVSSGFDNCITRDGQGQPTTNLPMAGFRHTGVANAQSATDYAAAGQVQNGSLNWTIAGGTADVITAIYTPAITALTDGLLLCFRATAANLTTAPTFSPNGLAAKTITKNGIPLTPGDIRGVQFEAILRYNAAQTTWILTNPPWIPVGGIVPYFGGTVPIDYLLPQGQNVAIASYPALNAVIGTTYGNPGGGNITLPDLRSRTIAGLDAGAGRITIAGGNFDGTVLGNAGGAQNKSITIAQANLPNVSFTNSGIAVGEVAHTHGPGPFVLNSPGSTIAVSAGTNSTTINTTAAATAGVTVSAQGSAASGGSGTALTPAIVQPTMVINVMMRAL